mmetsp:Transcript_65371/g.115987  ORF Transcript_65371/g.115987 Transcript_65371/m.115987 type:complete len:186 (-) Transcript_65371:35-592(-)
MAFFASLPRLAGPLRSRARDLMEPSAIINPKKPNDASRQLNVLRRMARQNGTLKRVFRTQRREFPTDTRKTNLMDQVYFRKWHHLKYCTQMIQYSIRHGHRLRDDMEAEAGLAQKPWADNVKTSMLGSGRLRDDEIEQTLKGNTDKESLEASSSKKASASNDAGLDPKELRREYDKQRERRKQES